MRRQSRTLLLATGVAVILGACSTPGVSPSPSWTYGPTEPPAAAATATPAPTASPTVAPSPTSATATITLSEWKVAAPNTFHAGSVTFTIANQGTTQHELLVIKSDLAPAAYPTDSAGDIVEDGAGVNLLSDGDNIDPQGTQQRTVDLVPGTYLFVCNIPGHFKSGMFTVVTVTP